MDAPWLKYLPVFLRVRLDGRHDMQAILSNSSWQFADKMLRLSVGMIVGVWLARYLGPEQFGQFNSAIAFVSLFSAIATLGLDGIVIRELVHNPEQIEEILGSTFVLKFSGGCMAFVITFTAIWFLHPEEMLSQWLVGIIALGLIFQAFDVIDFWFQSQVQSKYTVYAKNFAYLIISAVKIWLIVTHAGLIAFAWAGFAEILVGAMGLLLAFRAAGNAFSRISIRWNLMKELIDKSWPLLLSGLAVMLYMRLDIVMLREMSGDREAGIYAVATKLSEVLYFLPIIIVSSSFPAIIKSREEDREVYLHRLRKLYFVMVWLAIGASLPLSFLSGPLVNVLYGADYKEAAPLFTVQLWASIAVFLGVASSHFLLAEQLQKISFYRTVIGLICNIAINLILIPRLGAMGAAIATVLSYFAATFSLVLFRSTRAHTAYLLASPFIR